jgi:hypothetical protein
MIFFAYFHVLGLFRPKKYDLSQKKIHPARAGAYNLTLKNKKADILAFGIFFGPT